MDQSRQCRNGFSARPVPSRLCERPICSVISSNMSHKDPSPVISAPNALSEVMFFEPISFDAKNAAQRQYPRGSRKAERDLRVFPELGKECIRSASSPQRAQEAARPKSRDAIPIHHLLNAPDGDDLVPRFPIRDTPPGAGGDEDDATVNETEDSSEASHWSEDYENPHDVFAGASLADLEGMNFDSFFGGFESLTFGSYPLNADMSNITSGTGIVSPSAMALEPRAYEIRQLLLGAATKFAIEYPDSPQLGHLETNIGLLTHVEIDHCLTLFFNNYYRHCPIIHRPSFQPTIAPIPLVLGCVALGAMYSEQAKVCWMKNLLDVIESYIFSLPEVRDEFFGTLGVLEAPDEDAVEYHFQLFQGAYLFVVVQYFSGNLAGRRRARRQRFPSILNLARYFGLPAAQHSNVVAIPDDLAFQRWVRIEARIRTMNVLLALDSAMGIFNNVPPRINYCEVDLQLPCHPEYFELLGYADMLQRGSFPRPRMKLIEAFQKLFVHPGELKAAYQNENLCCWDMLYLTHVLYTHCWQHLFGNPLNRISSTSLASELHLVYEPMKTALANWKTLWDDVRAKLSRANVSEMGFETSADSYWTLVRMIVLKFEHRKSASSAASSINGAATNSTSGLAHREAGASDDGMSESSANGRATGGLSPSLDFMPLEADCDSQGAHLRKILQK
ncbi:Fungal specific transcription factor domain-containing protein [Cladophialophora immunda]|nr:Fungal specific transcription factor domain-containing protein [Cladophialophora immunda]